jgi:hypothetical protein
LSSHAKKYRVELTLSKGEATRPVIGMQQAYSAGEMEI